MTISLSIDDYERVEESKLRNQAANSKSKSLHNLLKIADEWRDAGCTPVFLIIQEDPRVIAVVAEETFGKYEN